MNHELKILPVFYENVRNGTKTFEIRDNTDRGFQRGDTVLLREWDHLKMQHTPKPALQFIIGYVMPIDHSNKVVLSLLVPPQVKVEPSKPQVVPDAGPVNPEAK